MMNCIIPFESRVKFAGTLKEICSVSLEHEITKNTDEILGNFIVSGTYKEHELSVNTSDFRFVIPFNVELTTKIENDSLEFSIDNFTYDIEGNEMIVKIDYIVSADDVREDIIIEDPVDLIEEVIDAKEDTIELEILEKANDEINIKPVKEDREEINEENGDVDVKLVEGLETENDYITYHIHIVKETDTIESICLNYKTTKDELERLNDISNLIKNSKLIIPVSNE